MSTSRATWILALSFALAAAGFLLPFWPLSLFGVAIAALLGHWIFAVLIGLLLDIAYGTPLGTLHYIYFPFTIFALIAAVIRHYLTAYVRKGSRDTL